MLLGVRPQPFLPPPSRTQPEAAARLLQAQTAHPYRSPSPSTPWSPSKFSRLAYRLSSRVSGETPETRSVQPLPPKYSIPQTRATLAIKLAGQLFRCNHAA